MMDLSSMLTLVGMILLNGGVILAAWIKSKTDIAAIKVEIKSMDIRMLKIEEDHSGITKGFTERLEKFSDLNLSQHDTLSTKIDNIKDSITDLKVQLAKK